MALQNPVTTASLLLYLMLPPFFTSRFSALLKQHPKASLAYQVSCVAVEDVDLCRQIGDGKSLETMLTLLRYMVKL